MADPIKPELYDHMNNMGKFLNDTFKPHGFCLLVFDFVTTKDLKEQPRMNYISNAQRHEMILALKEFIAFHEGRVHKHDIEQ